MRTVFALVTGAVLGTVTALWLAARRAAHEPPTPPMAREALTTASEAVSEAAIGTSAAAAEMIETAEAAAEEASA